MPYYTKDHKRDYNFDNHPLYLTGQRKEFCSELLWPSGRLGSRVSQKTVMQHLLCSKCFSSSFAFVDILDFTIVVLMLLFQCVLVVIVLLLLLLTRDPAG